MPEMRRLSPAEAGAALAAWALEDPARSPWPLPIGHDRHMTSGVRGVPLVRIGQAPIPDGRTAPITVRWDAWDTGGRHYVLDYGAPFGRVLLDDGREVAQFHYPGLYTAVIGLEEFLRLAGLHYEPAEP